MVISVPVGKEGLLIRCRGIYNHDKSTLGILWWIWGRDLEK
jgi:hypothetical protein